LGWQTKRSSTKFTKREKRLNDHLAYQNYGSLGFKWRSADAWKKLQNNEFLTKGKGLNESSDLEQMAYVSDPNVVQ
jgi:hypothetical protein